MSIRISLFLIVSLLFLPSCQHNLGGLFGPKIDPAVEFNYGEGSSTVHIVSTMEMGPIGQSDGLSMPVASFDLRYSTKKVGSGIAWEVVMDNLELGGEPYEASPAYSVSFTCDAKGRNKADMVKHHEPNPAIDCLADPLLAGINLPDGKFNVGDPSIPIPVEAMQSEGMEIIFSNPSPAYVYEGVEVVDGEECYKFSFKDDIIVRQGGMDMPGTCVFHGVLTKNLLTVEERAEIAFSDTAQGMRFKIVNEGHRVTAKSEAESAGAALVAPEGDWRSQLRNAPLQQTVEPVVFRYAPGSARFKANVVIKQGKKRDALVGIPFLSYSYQLEMTGADDRLAWYVGMSDLAMMGQPLELSETANITYTTDHYGKEIADFKDNSGLGILTVDDIRNDSVIPEGAFKSGDVCMPVRMGKQDSEFEYDFPEGSGYVFQGVKEVGSMRVAVLTADIDNFVARSKKTGKVLQWKLSAVRHYDLDTMLPLWFDGTVGLNLGEKGYLNTSASFFRVQD